MAHFDDEMLRRSGGLFGIFNNLHEVRVGIEQLTQMAEFVGEQYYPDFSDAVRGFKSAQEEELRRQKQQQRDEQRIRESLDAAVARERDARAKEAEAARYKFKKWGIPLTQVLLYVVVTSFCRWTIVA